MPAPIRTIIQLRRDEAGDWTTNSATVLASGEIGFESDTNKFKIGDGTTSWGSLPYAPAGLTYLTTSGTTSTVAVTRATNLAGGGAGQLPYNTAANTTTFLATGTSGQLLQSNGTSAPSWGLPRLDQLTTTTATQFRGIINGTTGTGNVVFASGPVLTSPQISTSLIVNGSSSGVTTITADASGTVALTLPATSGTVALAGDVDTNFVSKTSATTQVLTASLTVPSGKTLSTAALTASGTVTLSGSSGASTGVAKINASGVVTGGNLVTLSASGQEVTGILPLNRGGTGADTVTGAREGLRIFVQATTPTPAGGVAVGDVWFW